MSICMAVSHKRRRSFPSRFICLIPQAVYSSLAFKQENYKTVLEYMCMSVNWISGAPDHFPMS